MFVAEWVMKTPERLMFTNVIVMMELERGILSKERKDSVQGAILRRWFDTIVKPSFADKILNIDSDTAKICAALHIPDHTPENDAWIAASAIQNHLVLVTRNTADFTRTGAKLFNPFEKN